MSEEKKSRKDAKGGFLRRALMGGGVLGVLMVCVWFYFTGGRYVSTDNAYIKAAKILMTPEVSGTILSVPIRDNQLVKAGDTLLSIDPASYKIAVEEAQANAANVYTEIEQLKAQYRQVKEDMVQAQTGVDYANSEYDRRSALVKQGAVSKSQFDDSKRQKDAAIAAFSVLQEKMNGIVAALTNNPDIAPQDHPLYQKAVASLHEAELNLERTTLKAPVAGMIGTAPHVGDYARAGVPLFNLVGTKDIWIEANYKETELSGVKPGQPVTIDVDTYPGHEWRGHVESISPATGAEFSILPAQNATGNWVKVVQRIAVRIAVDKGPGDLPLRTGMSTYVTIDVGHYPHLPIGKAYAKS